MSVSTLEPETPVTADETQVRDLSLMDRIEAFISRLSTRNNFWHRVCSLIWLPYAFRSGITLRRLDSKRFSAVLPFKRSNRNWYNAMAGAALLGNSEVAAGMFLFRLCGSDYVVLCKEMNYRFLRPCFGPAVYEIADAETVAAEIQQQLDEGGAFNIDLQLDVRQTLKKKGKAIRVGRSMLTFHCAPKTLARERRAERRGRD